nr:threonine-phosphate decarboxylase CobD [Synechococcus sp. PCC 7336]
MAGYRHGGNLASAAAIAQCDPSEILDFSASLNPLGPPPAVLDAIARVTHPDRAAAIARYPDPQSRQLRQALAAAFELDPAWILAGNGAAELFTWAARDCARQGITAIPIPAFADYARALSTANAKWEAISCWDTEAGQPLSLVQQIRDRLQQPHPPTCLILTNPHNPTGQVWPVEAWLELLPQFDLAIVDEAFMDFLPDETGYSLLPWVERFPQLVVVRSLTKFYAIAGLRVGFVVGQPERLARWQQWRDPWSVNSLATVAAVAALGDRRFQQHTRAWLPEARQQLFEGLQAIAGMQPHPSSTNFLLVRSPVAVPTLQQQLLQSHRILIRDCLSFVPLGDRYFRIAIRSEDENLKFLRSLCTLLTV